MNPHELTIWWHEGPPTEAFSTDRGAILLDGPGAHPLCPQYRDDASPVTAASNSGDYNND